MPAYTRRASLMVVNSSDLQAKHNLSSAKRLKKDNSRNYYDMNKNRKKIEVL